MAGVHQFCEKLEPRRLMSAGDIETAAQAAVPRYDHVVVVMEENHSYNEILGPSLFPPLAYPAQLWPIVLSPPLTPLADTYIRSLAGNSAVFSNSHGIAHPSQPNYLALFSGSTQGVTSDATPTHRFTTSSLGGQLIAAGLTFTGYSEDLPHKGYSGNDAGNYVRHHNPWVNFTDVPAADNLPFSRFPGNYDKLPTVAFVVPNLQDDMHSDSIQTGDQWLESNLSGYAKWAYRHNSLLIIEWDEDNGTAGNQVPTIFAGAHVRPGQYSEPVNDYRILNTIEAMYGLARLGNAGRHMPITDVFRS